MTTDGDHFAYPAPVKLRLDPTSRIGLPTPWGRAQFTQSEVDELHARIPQGYRIVVTAWNGRSGRFNVRAWDWAGNLVSEFSDVTRPVNAARTMADVLAYEVERGIMPRHENPQL